MSTSYRHNSRNADLPTREPIRPRKGTLRRATRNAAKG